MNASYIEQLLTLRDKVSIRGLGTFSVSQKSAVLTGSSVLPPSRKVEYLHGQWDENDLELEDFLLVRNPSATREQVRKSIEDFIENINQQIEKTGKFAIGNLGFLVAGEWGALKFEPNVQFSQGGAHFGLPKLDTLPLQPAATEGEVIVPLAKKDTGILLLIVILIPLILVAAGATYLFFNPDAYTRFKEGRLFEVSDSKNPTPTSQPVAVDSAAAPPQKNSTRVQTAKGDSAATPAPTKPAPTSSEKPKPAPVQANVVSSPTNRFYVVVGVASSKEQALKEVRRLQANGYPGAKAVIAQQKNRIAIGDFATKAEADRFKTKVSGTYSGAWVLNF